MSSGFRRRPISRLMLAGALALGACTTESPEATIQAPVTPESTASVSTSATTTTAAPEPIITLAPSTLAPTTTAAPTTTTTTLPPPEPLPDSVVEPACVVRSTSNSFEQVAIDLAAISTAPIGTAVTGEQLWAENGFAEALIVGDLVDICATNGTNDIDGSPNDGANNRAITAARAANVRRQQNKLNELFAGIGSGDLAVDGDSGARTGQRLCGARLGLGLDTTTADMAPGSIEEAALFAATTLAVPTSVAAEESERWVVVDRTCQLLFAGTGPALTFAFNTSTGSEGFETRLQDRAEAFRFNPAVENGGWHDSSEFPVGVDNPLNGNMYKPLYFDLGQAIHGANFVPPVPDSKGCARLRVGDQNLLVDWLGLADAAGETWRKNEMAVAITVQGDFVSR